MPDLIEVRSVQDPQTGSPKYGNCTLTLGDGSTTVPFQNGRAFAERAIVEQYLKGNGDLEVPSLGIWRPRDGEGPMPVQSAESDLRRPDEEPDAATLEAQIDQLGHAEKAGLIGKLLGRLGIDPERAAALAAEALTEPSPTAAASGDGSASTGSSPAEETREERKLRETAEEVARLEAEGELDPDANGDPAGAKRDDAPVRVVPAGFDDKTQENELRCLAKKADGAQCANAAKDGGPACHLPPHRQQFTS